MVKKRLLTKEPHINPYAGINEKGAVCVAFENFKRLPFADIDSVCAIVKADGKCGCSMCNQTRKRSFDHNAAATSLAWIQIMFPGDRFDRIIKDATSLLRHIYCEYE